MSDPFVAEIRMFGFNFPPTGWAFCNGQLMPISQNTALFSLLGTFYGGDGKSTFALPNLQDSSPLSQGQGSGLSQYFVGQSGGTETVTLLDSEMPAHSHQARANSGGAGLASPANNIWASLQGRTPPNLFQSGAPNAPMNPLALSVTGSSFPHNNRQPYLGLNFCIALQGVFPARN